MDSLARNEVITGLDIGTTKVCALIAEVTDHGEILITGVGVSPSLGMKKGVVVDIESTTPRSRRRSRKLPSGRA